MSELDHDILTALARLLRSPRGDSRPAALRIGLLRRMMEGEGAWWTAERLAENDQEIPQVRDALQAMRAAGVLAWDQDMLGYKLRDELRVPVALVMISLSPAEHGDHLDQLDRLIPFARLASRSDAANVPVWAMIDQLERDRHVLRGSLGDGPEGLRQAVQGRWLQRSADSMNGLIERLEALGEQPQQAPPGLSDRAVELIGDCSMTISELSATMSASARDHLRVRGSRRAGFELRHDALALSEEDLSAALRGQAGTSVSIVRVPSCEELAAQLSETGAGGSARAYPDLLNAAPQQQHAELTSPPATDSRVDAQHRLRTRDGAFSQRLFADLPSWVEAVRLQHGLLRLHGSALRNGRPGWQVLAETDPVGGPVSRASGLQPAQAAQ